MNINPRNDYIITAAGGNATAIRVIDQPQSREWYAAVGAELMSAYAAQGVEQAGFLILSANHFEMSGAELCGNGTRAAGLLLSRLRGNQQHVQFSVSGHQGDVTVDVDDPTKDEPFVVGSFPNLSAMAQPITLTGVERAEMVDMGGIVHIIIYGPMPETREAYEAEHRRICRELNLIERDAVGVDWVTVGEGQVFMHPVVWVRGIDSFFYETSCGSGSISAAVATGIPAIVQPSGRVITVGNAAGALTISSELEVTHEFH